MIDVTGPGHPEILSKPALAFVEELHRAFEATRQALLQKRVERYRKLAAGGAFEFLPEKASVPTGGLRVAPPPARLPKPAIEIHRAVDGQLMIHNLNSRA